MTVADVTCPLHADVATHAIVASEELPAQFASCIHCVEDLRAWRDLRALGGSLEWTPPDADRSARVRARVVGTMSPRSSLVPRPFRGWLTSGAVGMAAVCSVLLVAFAATHREKRGRVETVRAEAPLGVIQQIGVARFERTSAAPDEVVRLDEGQVHISVAHLAPAERFRLETGDAVVEVRGTEFDVQASSGRLLAVAVERGRVEVRVGASEPAVLAEGGRWSASKSPIIAPPEPMPTPAPGRVAHAAEVVLHRPEGASSQVPPAASRSAAAKNPSSPPVLPVALSPGKEIPVPREVNVATPSPKPAVTPSSKPPEVIGGELQRREREDERSERRERREERRLERLERHR
jgi:hypothetical protein